MSINFYDIIILILLGGFVLFGLWFGFIHTIGSLLGTIAGAFLAGRIYEPVALWVNGVVGGSLNVERVIAFLLIFIVINRLVGFAFVIVEQIFKFISVLPFLKTIDRLLGAGLGLLEGVLVLGLTLYVSTRFPFDLALKLLDSSQIARTLLRASQLLIPLLPQALKVIRETVPQLPLPGV
ncbi:hypothetical protein A3F28_01990 [Candidatus Uhrbacteria bacterium RIFCSPHIGHO2_12_FULL_57_11]|uniref:Colicin V production protein n=1 Tax=Candidatus Uhrbacteria bacterium RIFCSPHIGHO2_12_FULL_57_11 TaxID=1802398 RepID=A0A1F7UHE5_9BACT|nr:MAG: hypothetical protein A3F28_01990 [Candidatus Uhrbacteria bacterium RIFCSPHIGHO2_12_FULL_57_11]